jgi:hypothetical protein
MHQCILPGDELFMFLSLDMYPMVQPRPTLGVWSNDQVIISFLELFQSIEVFFPIGIHPREHFGTLFGHGGSGTDWVKVKSNGLETGKTFGRKAIPTDSVVEFALSTNPVTKLRVGACVG